MLDSLMETLESFFDSLAAFIWQQFEKDMAMTEAILARTDQICDRVEKYFRTPR